MVKRYVPRSPKRTIDKKGRKRHFSPDHLRRDGTRGYLESEIADLYPDSIRGFEIIEVSGLNLDGVEQATAAPGEKRSLTGRKGHQCDECEFASKSAAGLAAHKRVHDE